MVTFKKHQQYRSGYKATSCVCLCSNMYYYTTSLVSCLISRVSIHYNIAVNFHICLSISFNSFILWLRWLHVFAICRICNCAVHWLPDITVSNATLINIIPETNKLWLHNMATKNTWLHLNLYNPMFIIERNLWFRLMRLLIHSYKNTYVQYSLTSVWHSCAPYLCIIQNFSEILT